MANLVLKRGADRRLRAGHPWVYRGEIADLKGKWSAGAAVDVLDTGGHFLGRGFYNPRPTLACRLLTRLDEPIDPAFFVRRLRAALDHRRSFLSLPPLERGEGEGTAYRLCWSEADGLPGLVVDRYGPVSVIQCLTLGMSRALPWVAGALRELFPDGRSYRLDDPTAARIEGFEPVRGWLAPPPHFGLPASGGEGSEIVFSEGACRFSVVLERGQKTGFYLDQRDNRVLVGSLASGRRMLDAFCYAGAFACQALRAGATQAFLIDSSADALALARRNLELNGLTERALLDEANVFDRLRKLEQSGERFGMIVLDPPPFTRRKDAVEAAARGYKEINLRALRLLEPGGLLATFSCSHHITPALFEAICREAAGDSGIQAGVLATLTQSRDHPVLLAVPETRYLTGLLLQAI